MNLKKCLQGCHLLRLSCNLLHCLLCSTACALCGTSRRTAQLRVLSIITTHAELCTAVKQAAAASVATTKASPLQALLAVARNMVPDNVVLAAVDMNILGIITFSLFFGICLASLGDQADGFIGLITVRTPLP